MEARLGHNFSGVRVHSGPEAAQAARDVNATAFTVDQHVVLGADAPSLQSNNGQRLLVHELAHVIQQTAPDAQLAQSSPVTLQQAEAEAAQAAGAIMAGRPMPSLSRVSGPVLQSSASGTEETAAPDMKITELYPIHPGAENKGLQLRTRSYDETVGDVYRIRYVDTSFWILNQSGLRAYLSLLAHGPLGRFEENLIRTWGNEPSDVLTPLVRHDDESYVLIGLILVTGGSGDRITTAYTRQGEVLRQYHDEAGLVNMGLGPIDWALMLAGAAAIAKLGLAKAAAWRAAAKAAARKEFIHESEAVFAVIKDGEIIASSRNTSLSHAEFVERELPGGLPEGAEVVTIGKHRGEIGAIRSATFHTRELPASAAAQEAARRAYR
jgi:hypothetical protein